MDYRKAIREEVLVDLSKNDLNLLSGFVVRLVKNVSIVFEVSYQIGMLFLIVCVAVEEFYDGVNYKDQEVENRFLIEYGLHPMDKM